MGVGCLVQAEDGKEEGEEALGLGDVYTTQIFLNMLVKNNTDPQHTTPVV